MDSGQVDATSGRFLVFEGINGCGKGIVVDEFGRYFESKGLKIFDLREFNKIHGDFPQPETIADYDVILSAEPTHAWVGKAIRAEMFYDNGRDYEYDEMLSAYALDRDILYKRIIVPLRKMGKIIIQERTLSSTVAMQALCPGGVSLEELATHPCHRYVLQNLPDTICVVDAKPEVAAKWLDARDKKDVDIYERLEKQTMTYNNYNSEEFKEFFESRGSKVVYLMNDSTLDSLIAKTHVLAQRVLDKYTKLNS
jgi:thymidylate kinase